MAAEMSPSREPAFAAPMAASRARVVVSMRSRSFWSGRADDHADRRVGDPSVDRAGEVETEQVAVAQHVVVRQPVQDSVVDRGAQHLPERHRAERGVVVDVAGLRPALTDHVVRESVELEQVHAHVGHLGQPGEHLGHEASRRSHLLDLGRGTELDHEGEPTFDARGNPDGVDGQNSPRMGVVLAARGRFTRAPGKPAAPTPAPPAPARRRKQGRGSWGGPGRCSRRRRRGRARGGRRSGADRPRRSRRARAR